MKDFLNGGGGGWRLSFDIEFQLLCIQKWCGLRRLSFKAVWKFSPESYRMYWGSNANDIYDLDDFYFRNIFMYQFSFLAYYIRNNVCW